MKAVLLTKHGGPEMLRYGEAPDPIAAPGEVVVDIYAASVNAADYKVRLGGGRYALNRFPHVLGRDFSGVVSALGADVADFAVGDAVFGVTDQGIEGTYAEKIATKAAIIAKKPDRLSHAEAAALGLISLTALTAIEDTAHLNSLRCSLGELWKNKSDEIDHKGEEHRPHSDLYVVVDATRYFPCFE